LPISLSCLVESYLHFSRKHKVTFWCYLKYSNYYTNNHEDNNTVCIISGYCVNIQDKTILTSTVLNSRETNQTCGITDLGANISGGIMETMCAMSGGMVELTWVLPSDVFTSTLVTVFSPSVNVKQSKHINQRIFILYSTF